MKVCHQHQNQSPERGRGEETGQRQKGSIREGLLGGWGEDRTSATERDIQNGGLLTFMISLGRLIYAFDALTVHNLSVQFLNGKKMFKRCM